MTGPEPLRFGDIAVALGFVHRWEVEAAVVVQKLDAANQRPHRLIGQVLVDLHCMTHRQVAQVLDLLLRHTMGGRAPHHMPHVDPLVVSG